MGAVPTENDVRAAMAVGKKVVVLSEVDDYELCVPEDGFRPKDSFWRKRKMDPVSQLVEIVKMSGPPPVTQEPEVAVVVKLAPSLETLESPIESAEQVSEPQPSAVKIKPLSMKLQLLRKDSPSFGLERGEKICIDCELPYPFDAFYTNSSARDGRQSRCKECDNKRRSEHNQGLHVKVSEKADFVRDASRKRASEVAVTASATAKTAGYVYKGISGGFLIYGYVR